jgi:PAS domain S-box-containing protein
MPRLSPLRFAGLTTEASFKMGLVLTSALLIAALAWMTWHDFDDARHDAEARAAVAATVVKGHAARSISAIDGVLASVVELVGRDGDRLDALRFEAQEQRLHHIAARLPETGEVFVYDRAGDRVATTTADPVSATNVSDREWFKLFKAGHGEVEVGRAIKSRFGDRLCFPVVRAIRGTDGSFNGAVQVNIDVSYVAQFFRDLELGPGAHFRLHRASDGVVIARYPMTEALLNETVASRPFFSALEKAPQWTGWEQRNAEMRLVSAQLMENAPIIASVSLPKGEVYAGAWSRLPGRALVASTIWVALFALTAVAVRQVRQEAGFRDRLSASEARFREMANHAPVMVWVTEPGGSCGFLSRSWYEFTGQSAETGLGLGWVDNIHPHDRAMLEERRQARLERRDTYQVEYRLRRHDGVYRWVIDAAAPRFDGDGTFLGYMGSVIDMSERKEAELELAERRAQLALAAKAAQVGGYILDVAQNRIQVSEGYADIYQLPADATDISVDAWRATVHPEDLEELDARRTQSFAERQRERISEYRILRRDGEVRWIEARSLVTYDSAGQPQRMVGVNFDMTSHKRAEERQSALIAELNHRVKNVLAKVVAIAARTRQSTPSPDEFGAAFEGRIRSLANAHALLSRNLWQGVSLAEIVHQELAPYTTRGGSLIEGPEVSLAPEAGQVLMTVLHELATNAAKHGALSVPEGRVSVQWDLAGDPVRLVLHWREHNGPHVTAPTRVGFGARTIQSAISHQLDGRVDLAFMAGGISCTIELPVDRLSQGSS